MRDADIIETELMEISAIPDDAVKFERIVAWCATHPEEVPLALHQIMRRRDKHRPGQPRKLVTPLTSAASPRGVRASDVLNGIFTAAVLWYNSHQLIAETRRYDYCLSVVEGGESMNRCLVTGLGLVLLAGSGFSQSPNASLGGTVSDASGAVVPHATVIATNNGTGVATPTQSNDAGAYQFPSLQAGTYRVSAEMTGFQKVTFDPVVLDVAAQLRLNFTLAVAGSKSVVEVTAAAESPLLAASSNVGGVVQGQQILDLPLVDQNATNLAVTQAGFAGGIGSGVNVDGGATHA